jgi:hypothetical protein
VDYAILSKDSQAITDMPRPTEERHADTDADSI